MEEENNNFTDLDDIRDIKYLLQHDQCGMMFNNNILKIALNLKEEKIASVLVADFQVEINEKMMTRAIKTQ